MNLTLQENECPVEREVQSGYSDEKTQIKITHKKNLGKKLAEISTSSRHCRKQKRDYLYSK